MSENEVIVDRKLEAKAKKLAKKYAKQRKVNEKLLRPKKWWQSLLTWTSSILMLFVIFIATTFSVSVVVSKINKTAPIYLGTSCMKIASGSMKASGFEIGDVIVTHSVKPETLSVGDNIAFYVSYNDMRRFNSQTAKLIETNQKIKFTTPISTLLGIHSKKISTAAKTGCKIVFHQIVAVYEDENGERWFKTKGTSNSSSDTWTISESMVIGAHATNGFSKMVAAILNAITNDPRLLVCCTLLPFILVVILVAGNLIKDIALIMIELDIVEEKRKLTDDICVRNKIGYQMGTKVKYKVLAQAKPEEFSLYMSLLWENGSTPANVKKYYKRKALLLRKNQELLELNRECQEMFKNNETPTKIAKHYNDKRSEIEKRHKERVKKLNAIKKKYKNKKPQADAPAQ